MLGWLGKLERYFGVRRTLEFMGALDLGRSRLLSMDRRDWK
ncbi:unnamed protein product [Acidithrix sp. C25]|nr:unnamed protein product [Acidithrix sp. C25]